jgi:hypothetical protein
MATRHARIRRRQLAAVTRVVAVITPMFNVLTSQASLAEVVQGVVESSPTWR